MSNIELYPHNQETYEVVKSMWKDDNKVAVIQATGTGKSYLILKCIEDFKDNNTLVLAPSSFILSQLCDHSINGILNNTLLMTYSKLARNDIDSLESFKPSLIILDEFHRCGAEKWGKGVVKLLETFPDAKILGTSATPIRYLDNERDMSDELFENNIAVNLSLSEAIIREILPMPKYISALYSFDNEINSLEKKIYNSHLLDEEKEKIYKEILLMKHNLNKSRGIPEILKKYINTKGGKYLVFCKNKAHLESMVPVVTNWFKESGLCEDIDSYYIYIGNTDNESQLNSFKNNKNSEKIKLLFSIDMFNEGIHIDDVNGVILLRPTLSPIIYYQQIGRSIQAGNIHSPLIFDLVNNFNNVSAQTFIRDLQEARTKVFVDKDFDDIEEFTIYDETQGAIELFNSIRSKICDNWDILFNRFKEYYIKNGTIRGLKKVDINCAKWLVNQRGCLKKGVLSQTKIDRLNSVYPEWSISLGTSWKDKYEQLKEFIITNGNSNITRNDVELYSWASRQKLLYSRNKLKQYKIDLLNEIGFDWTKAEDRLSWFERYQMLKDYFIKHNHSLVSEDDDVKLCIWVKNQRVEFKNGGLSKEQIDLLNQLDFIWRFDYWTNKFTELKKFKDTHGHCNVPPSNKSLYGWIIKQRGYYNKNRLSQEKIHKLNDIGFVFNSWEEYYNNIEPDLGFYHIKNILKRNRMKNTDLAHLLNIVQSSVNKWCNNKRTIPVDKCNEIGKIFSIDPSLIEPRTITKEYEEYGKNHVANIMIRNEPMTFNELAELLNVPYNTLIYWVFTKRSVGIPLDVVKKIGEIFNIPPETIEPRRGDNKKYYKY